jgi:hypothetical protein
MYVHKMPPLNGFYGGGAIHLFFFSTQAMHIKTIMHYNIAMFSLKTIYLDGIRTRVLTCPLRHAFRGQLNS